MRGLVKLTHLVLRCLLFQPSSRHALHIPMFKDATDQDPDSKAKLRAHVGLFIETGGLAQSRRAAVLRSRCG